MQHYRITLTPAAYLHDFLHDKLVCCADIVFLLFVQDKLPPLDTVMDFSPLRFPSRLIRAFGLSFMGSLVLLSVQQQHRGGRGGRGTGRGISWPCAVLQTTTASEWTHRSGFVGLSQPGGGRQSGALPSREDRNC